MNNKLTLQASAMLGRLVKRGGKYQITDHSPERCALTIEYKDRKFVGEITWAEAQEEPFVYAGKQSEVLELLKGPPEGRKKLRLSGNYATPRRRMQHLWARVVSDSVRVVAPDLVSGSYTPEEVADFSGVTTTTFAVKQATEVPEVGSSFPNTVNGHKPEQNSTTKAVDLASEDQVLSIENLIKQLEVPDSALSSIYAKRGVSYAAEMTREQASEFIIFLREKLSTKNAAGSSAAAVTATTTTGQPVSQARVDGPVTKELEDRLRQKIKEVAQSNGQGKEFTDKIKLKLDASGMKLSDMTYNDASKLLTCLETMQIEEFFLHVLTIPEPGPTLYPDPGEEADAGKKESGGNPS